MNRLALAAPTVAIAAGLVVLGLAATSPVLRHQAALSFTHQPERFTALHVTDPARLPTTVTPGRPVAVDFGIDNHEGKTRRYGYVATLTGTGERTLVARGTVTIADGERARRRVALGVPRTAAGYLVTVRLDGTGETIRYRVGPAPIDTGGPK